MDKLENVTQIDYVVLILTFFSILFGLKEIIEILSYFKKKFRISTGRDDDKNTLEERISKLERHDNWQYQEIVKISQGVNKIQKSLLEKDIQDIRRTILDFCSSLSSGQNPNQEAFEFIFKLYEKYENILKINGLENGQITASMEVIEDVYKEKLKNGF